MSQHAYHRRVCSSVQVVVRLICWLLGITMLTTGTAQAVSAAPAQVPDPNPSEITQPIELVSVTSPMAAVAPALNVPAAPAAPANPPAVPEHTFKSGDTLGEVAAKHGAGWKCLQQENGIGNVRSIPVGKVVKIVPECLNGHGSSSTERGPPPAEQEPNQESDDSGSSKAQQAVRAALSKDGASYNYGSAGPNSFDCSGLVYWAYKKAGVNLPRSSGAMSDVGTPVSKDNLRSGDLLFFYEPVSHVAMYIGEGEIIQASTEGKPVHIRALDERRMKSFNSARRVA